MMTFYFPGFRFSKFVFILAATLGSVSVMSFTPLQAALTEKMVGYKQGDTALEGFAIYDSLVSTQKPSKKPGILIIHDWMGLSDRTKAKAKQVADLGFVTFAADIYGKGIHPNNPSEAGKLAGQYKKDRKLYRERLNAALEELKKLPGVDTSKIAAIGFCFGGTGVIELVRSGADLRGVVSFHGGLDSPTPSDGKNIKAKVLALHGADDPNVPAKDVAAFEDEMRNNGVDWQLVKFGGAVHSFTDKSAGTDNSKGAAYNEKADKRSWQMMRDFFKEIF